MDKNRGNAPVDRWKVIAGICIAVAVAAGVALVCLLRDFYGEEMESETKMEELRGVSLEAEGAEETGRIRRPSLPRLRQPHRSLWRRTPTGTSSPGTGTWHYG